MFELIDEPRLKDLQEKVSALERERSAAEVQAGQLRVALQDARNEDLNAEALALNAGKKVPKAKAPELEAKLEDAQRSAEVLQRRLSLAQADVSKYIAEHHEEISARLLEAEQREAVKVAEGARQLLADLSRLWQIGEDAKRLRPYRQPAHDENAPAQKLSTSVIGVATHRAAGPERGHIEQMLSYLASLGVEDTGADNAA